MNQTKISSPFQPPSQKEISDKNILHNTSARIMLRAVPGKTHFSRAAVLYMRCSPSMVMPWAACWQVESWRATIFAPRRFQAAAFYGLDRSAGLPRVFCGVHRWWYMGKSLSNRVEQPFANRKSALNHAKPPLPYRRHQQQVRPC